MEWLEQTFRTCVEELHWIGFSALGYLSGAHQPQCGKALGKGRLQPSPLLHAWFDLYSTLDDCSGYCLAAVTASDVGLLPVAAVPAAVNVPSLFRV